jgi:hypothetical protein
MEAEQQEVQSIQELEELQQVAKSIYKVSQVFLVVMEVVLLQCQGLAELVFLDTEEGFTLQVLYSLEIQDKITVVELLELLALQVQLLRMELMEHLEFA